MVGVRAKVKLTWQDNSLNETGFILERSTDNFVSNVTQIATPAIHTPRRLCPTVAAATRATSSVWLRAPWTGPTLARTGTTMPPISTKTQRPGRRSSPAVVRPSPAGPRSASTK